MSDSTQSVGKTVPGLGFVIDGGVIRWDDGGCQPATDAEVALWEEVKRLKARIEVAESGYHAAVRTAQWQASTNSELNDLQRQLAHYRKVTSARLEQCWPDLRNRGLLQAAKQAVSALHRHAMLPWGQPGYPTPNPGCQLIEEARACLTPAIEKEEAFRAAVPMNGVAGAQESNQQTDPSGAA